MKADIKNYLFSLFMDPLYFVYVFLDLVPRKETLDTDGYQVWNAEDDSTRNCNPENICPPLITYDDLIKYQNNEFELINEAYIVFFFIFVGGILFLAIIVLIYYQIYK